MEEVRTVEDARRLEGVLSSLFGGGIRGTVRRAPYAMQYLTTPRDRTEPVPAPPPAMPAPAPAPAPVRTAPPLPPTAPARTAPPLPPPNQRGSLTPPPAPAPTRGRGAAAPAPIQRAAAPTAPTPSPSGPVDRARFAAFFPNDPTTDLIRQQAASGGIGGLMGG